MKRKLKKVLKKAKAFIYEKKITLNLDKVCRITDLQMPTSKEIKKLRKKKISEPVISWTDIKPNCLYYVFWYPMLTDEIKQKIRQNALFVVTPKPIEGCNNIICDNVVELGLQLFKYIRKVSKAKVISVTGSVGKTSTKEMIECVLKQKYKRSSMIASVGNSNSSYKAALNIKKLNSTTKVLLQEVGAGSKAYDIVKRSAVILNSDIVVYTNIKDSHIEWYGSRENIAKEKFTLSDYGKKDGLAIINYDDEILNKHEFISTQTKLSYSLKNKNADVYAKKIKITSNGTSFIIVDNIDNEEHHVSLKVIGEHHVLNALVAYLIGKKLDIKPSNIIKGLSNYKTSGTRQNLIDLGKYKVLADCYNSSYDALSSILETFNIIKANNKGEKIAVIGDVFELGDLSKEIHTKIGKLLTKYNFKAVVFNGEKTHYSYEEYKKHKSNGHYTKTREELITTIKKLLKEDDIILFKASHGMNFAGVIDSIFGTEVGERMELNNREYKTIEKDNFVYEVFKSHVTMSKYKGNNKKIIIPDKINNLPVEKIEKEAFLDYKNLKEVELNKSMVRLKLNCFKNSGLEKIIINDNLKVIGSYAFNTCKNLKEVILPEEFLSIEKRAFYKCSSLKKIKIPNSVRIIDDEAFKGTNNLTIECKKNSYAENYAKTHDLEIKYY